MNYTEKKRSIIKRKEKKRKEASEKDYYLLGLTFGVSSLRTLLIERPFLFFIGMEGLLEDSISIGASTFFFFFFLLGPLSVEQQS